MKKSIVTLLITALIITMLPLVSFGADSSARPFNDVPKNQWYYDDVYNAYYNGIFKGTSKNTFSPGEAVTRGMFVTVLYRQAGSPAVTGNRTFSDVPQQAYYADAVEWASKNGVAKGYTGGTFGPDDRLTREQVAIMLYNYCYLFNKDSMKKADEYSLGTEQKDYSDMIAGGDETMTRGEAANFLYDYFFLINRDSENMLQTAGYSLGTGIFEDADQVSDWAVKYMAWANAEGFINGREDKGKYYLAPHDSVSRAEACAMLNRYNVKYNGAKMKEFRDEIDYTAIASLDNSRKGFWFGTQYDELNRPVETLRFQSDEGVRANAMAIDADAGRKVIYLTIDEGYEAGFTNKILDILAEKNVKAVFFITGTYYRESKWLVSRMISDGHVVGNHSNSHPENGMRSLSLEQQYHEIEDLQNYLRNDFGYEMTLFRSPSGIYSEQTNALVDALHMKSVFWSFGYGDYDTSKQPPEAESLEKLKARLHPGAVYLLHAISSTNTNILGRFIDYARSQGYTFELVVND